ncbi:MAG: hypothetical protein ABMA25_04785 [Ilumatobacteraceae bacterium]
MSDADDALGTDAFGAADPDEQPGGRRRRYGVLVAVVAVVALAVGLLVWQPWSSDETAAPTTTAPALSSELVIGVEGLTLTRSLQTSEQFGAAGEQEGFLFAAPGADLEKGPYLAFLVSDLIDGDSIDGDNTLEIDGHEAVVENSGDTIEIYWEGEPGVRYGVASAGVTQVQAIAFAKAVSYDGGITTVDDPDAIEGMEPAGDIGTLFGMLSVMQPEFPADPDTISLEYATEQGDTVTLMSIEATGDFTTLAALLLDDERTVEVDGEIVVIGSVDVSFAANDGVLVLITERGGRLIGITATGVDDNGLLALLAGVRTATDDEWAEVLSVVEDPMDEFLSSDEGGKEVVVAESVPATALPDDTEP